MQVTLRCQPRPATSEWFTTDADPFAVRRALYRPSCIAWDGTTTHVLLEGVAADVDAERSRLGAPRGARAPRRRGPTVPTAARISVRPSALRALTPDLDAAGVRWLAEVGVGTVHVAADDERALAQARAAADAGRAAGCCARPVRPVSTASASRCPTRGSPSASAPRSTPPASARPAASRGTGRRPMTDLARAAAGARSGPASSRSTRTSWSRASACGLCLPHCPTYRVTGLERLSPRGRIAAMRAVELDGAPLDDAFRDTIETCVQCLGCEAACPSTVPFGHLVEGTNAGAGRPSRARRRDGRAVVAPRRASGSRSRSCCRATPCCSRSRGCCSSRSGSTSCPKRFGLPAPVGARRCARRSSPTRVDGPVDAYLFPGCVMDAWQRDVHRAALRVMRAAGARRRPPGPRR